MMDLQAVKARVNLVELVGRFVDLKKDRAEYVGLCPFHNERTPSFRVYQGDQHFHCFGCGARGDCFDFVFKLGKARDYVSAAEYFNCRDIVEQSAAERVALRRKAAARDAEDARDAEETRRAAYAIWQGGAAAGGTLVEAYLRGRGYMGEIPRTLRFAPAVWCKEAGAELPTMISAIVNGQGTFLSLHRTWICRGRDGRVRKADLRDPKKSLGKFGGGAIRLYPMPFYASGGLTLYVGEGIETSLSIVEALRRRPDRLARAAVWAGVSLTNMSRLQLPMADDGLAQAFERVVIVMDNDMKDTKGALTCELLARERWEPRAIEVRVVYPPRGSDLNDVLTNSTAEISPAIARARGADVVKVLEAFPGATIETIDGKSIEGGTNGNRD
jgi:DNA primase